MIASALKAFFSPSSFADAAGAAYVPLVDAARRPWFYQRQGVPDTVDGRFDVMVLHMFLLMHRLRKESSKESAGFIRALTELFFADMDRSLREMGAGDTGVGKRVKNMAEAFYGRVQAYEHGLGEPQALREAIRRNVFRGREADVSRLAAMEDYIGKNVAHLAAQDTAGLLAGKVAFLTQD